MGLFWSLGIYALVCIILVMLLILYYLISYLMRRFRWLKIVERYLRRKLFYSSAIRFMVESNLKITHNSIFYLLMLGSFKSAKETISTIFTLAFLAVIILWPAFLTVFLLYNRKQLEKRPFQRKFHSMYLRIKTDRYLGSTLMMNKSKCFLYNVVFCIRRLTLVLSYFFLQDYSGQVLYAILLIQSFYIVYITHSMPHIETSFNVLELFNELSIVLVVYSLKGFSATSIFLIVLQYMFTHFFTLRAIFYEVSAGK